MTDLMPRPVTDSDCHAWHGERLVLGTNPQGIGRPGLEVVLTTSIDEGTGSQVPHVCVPFVPDEISLARLAQGGTLWVCLLGMSTVPLFVTTDPDIEPAPTTTSGSVEEGHGE